jgi:peptidoglycan L-alanyl-D-glutamate endopeptidase CwlK
MAYKLGIRSRLNLRGVHPDLVKVVERAIELTEVDFTVTEGLRSKERQKQLFAAGASMTLNSRHLTGHAVDVAALVGGKVRWDWPLYGRIASAFKQAAKELDIPIVWGGDWTKLRDGPHFELNRATYP